jgi:hypothetical protein
MNVVKANCRAQFTAADVEFIESILSKHGLAPDSFTSLLSGEEHSNSILDNDVLFQAILEENHCLKISGRLYFYVLVRRVLRNAGIDQPDIADYVAEMLAEFSAGQRANCPVHPEQPMSYLFEMLAAIEHSDDRNQFRIRAHVGNHTLFFSGIYAEHLEYRAKFRGAPEIKYYEDLGRMNFRVARDHRLAKQYDLSEIYDSLSDGFHSIRLALNDMTDRLISLGDRNLPFGTLLRPSS